jgi:drug/metabolite transporter (DMT)-like permease
MADESVADRAASPPALGDANPAQRRLGIALVTISAVAWSTAGYFTRLIPLDAWTLLAWRGIFGGIGIAVAAALIERPRRFTLALGGAGWLFAIVSAAAMVLFITSLTLTTVAHVAIIYATIPLIAAGIGWLFLRERPGARALAAGVAALIGVVVMSGLSAEGGWLGDLIALAMTLAMGGLVLIARRFPRIPALPAAAASALIAALVSWPFGHPLAVSPRDLVLLAVFGLTQSALGIALFALGARYLPAVETGLIGALDAPLAPLWVWLAFGETPSAATLMGGLVVFAAVGVYLAVGARGSGARLSPDAV